MMASLQLSREHDKGEAELVVQGIWRRAHDSGEFDSEVVVVGAGGM
jgi:hypothetical protein